MAVDDVVDSATAAANSAAQNAYYAAKTQGVSDDNALAWAKFAWQKKLDEAQQTGKWNGIWNNPQEQWFTGQFGQWFGEGGAPTTGAYTLPAQQQAMAQSAQYGQYFAPGTNPAAGMATQSALQNAQGQAAQNAQLTGWLYGQGNSTGNIAQDAWNARASPEQKAAYMANANGDPQAAANRWWTDMQGTLNDALRQGQFQNVNEWVYGPAQQTLAGQQQQWSQAFQQSQADIAQQNWMAQYAATQAQNTQQNTLAYLQQLANLRGPADWAKYQQVLGSTPQGMRDLYAAAMGNYIPGGGATTGVQPQAANLGTMQQQIAGNTGNTGNNQVWGSGIGVGQQGQTPDQAQQATGNGTNMYGGQQQQYNLPAPNQIAPQAWKNMAPSQQQMLLGMYEANGWDKNDVNALYNQSLPKYGSNNATAGTWRLQ